MDLSALYEGALSVRGFSVNRSAGCLRLVKAHCEVHVCETPAALSLKVPVVRAPRGEMFPERLLTYLEDRNASPIGPGAFIVEGGCVWCRCEIRLNQEASGSGLLTPDEVAATAAGLVAQVERLGPKILNLK